MKQFIKLILKNVLILIVLILLVKLIPKQHALASNSDFVRQFEAHQKMSDLSKKNFNIIIGDSRADFGLKDPLSSFTNLSLRGSTPLEGYLTINKILNQGIKIDSIIISYGPLLVHTQLTYFSQTKYYDLFDDNFSKQELVYAEALEDPVYKSTNGWINESIPKAFYPIYYSILDFLAAITGYPYSIINFSKNQIELDKTNLDPFCISPEINRAGSYKESLTNEVYLNKIFEILNKNKIKYFYVHTPLIETSQLPTSKNYWSYYYNKTKKLNPINDSLPLFESSLFRDCAHLNYKGASIFSEIIFNKIRIQ